MEPTEKQSAADRTVFRNISKRIFYLRQRPSQNKSEKSFPVRQGQTVQALDEKEEKMLAEMTGSFVDVSKESPLIVSELQKAQKELAEALAENAKLKAESKASGNTKEEATPEFKTAPEITKPEPAHKKKPGKK